jgi:FtsP/CotA-like multicopper oxidase with cupredoxin domain
MRLLNASTARSYNFGFSDGREFALIATDGGLLEAPTRRDRIQLSPGERAEIVAEFDPGDNVILRSFEPDRRLTRSHQASSCSWKSARFANSRPGRKFERMNRCDRSSAPFACASPTSKMIQPTPSWPQNPANSSLARPPGAIALSRSHTSFCGSAPILDKPRPTPHKMSGASLEKISAPAITRDQHSSAVTTQPRRV